MEIIANAVQSVKKDNNILFTDTVVCGSCSIVHRPGSGQVSLRGLTNTQCRARFRISFGANIAIPSTGVTRPISLAIAMDGEPIAATTMIETPAGVNQYHNVSSNVFLDIPKCCCSKISVMNTSDQTVDVQNANLIIERVA